LVLGAIAAIGWQFRSLFGRDAGVAMLVLFMALKPLEMNTRRDAMVVVMLGYFLLLTHYFYSQSIPTGLWLLAACTLLTADPDPAAWRRPAVQRDRPPRPLACCCRRCLSCSSSICFSRASPARSGACRRTPTPA
jgi:hypothetical protein